MKIKSFISTIIGLAIFASALYLSYGWLTHKPRAFKHHIKRVEDFAPLVETIKPKPIDKPIEVEAFGTVIPVRTQTLSARVSSQIVYISPRLIPGSVVKKGELLIELDDTDFRLALKKSRSNVENAKLQLSQEVENQKSAMFEFSMADQNVSEAQKRYILRYPHVEAAKANLEAQKAALKRAEIDLKRCKIYAPFTAVVLNVTSAVGDVVGSSKALATLARADAFWVRTAISLETLNKLNIPGYNAQKGSKVVVKGINGVIEGVEKMVDESSKMAYLLIRIDDPLNRKEPLFLNEFVRLEIEGRVIKNIIEIPSKALHSNDEVWIVGDDKHLHIRRANVVWSKGDKLYIDANILKSDELIVTTLIENPVDGMLLRVAGNEDKVETSK
ncbi:efflux RND transporter periplasmic adaptor subunit [Hydrogenimonas thermophila]|uniref:efflux RND transporter periplasmic adaptor subunit n=1 Tax=Hydrogenimonas thermophila TaxID=223786 RepID=UPI00293732D6|nr:efflux RND transporter periplasmic adaptor subunit [Hydrogenimonas thermophila]WOE69462.1 efflux RND transporter periplasmic adaptor subunit [Hydrogenimonas thermophila]WOE71973.1 efflux RND transporter periplasmic adaptor subunit [Hydrogenimonas thermophila]